MGKPWITRIPFPVHVVEKVETYDRISRNHFVTSYAYHHGYFDGIEREFRGFGRVDQKDTEEFSVLSGSDAFPLATNIDEASHVPPVITKTWFHTGAYLRGQEISRQLSYEYFGAPDHDTPEFETFRKTLLVDTFLPSVAMTADETCEACRTLKGSILRQEVYAQDGSPKAGIPYSVSERNYTIKQLQPRGSNQHAIFFTHANETINYHYERNIQDPRIQHEMVIGVDDFGNVERSVAIGYPRCDVPDRQPEQMETHITLTVNRFINSPELPIKFPARYFPENPDWYRVGVPSETQTYEIVNPPEPTVSATTVSLFKLKDIRTLTEGLFPLHLNEPDISKKLPYEMWNWRKDATTPSGQRLRPIERVRTIYRMNDLTGLLMPDQVDSLALPGESYKLAFTPDLLTNVFVTRTDDDMFTKGGYVHSQSDSNWWIPSGRVFYHSDPAASPSVELAEASSHFFLPRRLLDPFDQSTFIRYDSYDLLPLESEDPLENKVTSGERDTYGVITPKIDYRVLSPYLVTDPNGNRSQVIFDVLGMVAGAAVMGKANEPDGKPKGDLMDGFKADITLSEIQKFIADPRGKAKNLLKDATTRIIYDIDRFSRCGQPPFAATLAREIHTRDPGSEDSPIQISFTYSDGFGREIQSKIQAESGDAPKREEDEILADGDIEPGRLVLENGKPKQAHADHRWVGKGRTVYNNKGKPVKQYEPYFSSTHLYEEEPEMTDTGVTPVLFYDPVERVVATLHPNHTYEKVVFDPWRQESWDVNDTVAMDPRTDADIKGYVSEYFEHEAPHSEEWKTWLKQRGVEDPDNPPIESLGMDPKTKAALRTLPHADTPTVAYFDTLGRPFLTIAHNKFQRRTNGYIIIIEEKYRTPVVLDIEGNQREVRDERKNKLNNLEQRIVMKYDYDMLGSRVHQFSMEAGERWMLNDVTGKPIRAWDSRGHNFWTKYDELRRPVCQFVTGTDVDNSDPRILNKDVLFAKTEYGENQTNDVDLNLRTRVFRHSDSAGFVTNMAHNPVTDKDEAYDFKGNLLRSTRDLAHDYREIVNWSNAVKTDETFTSSTTFDALNRPIQMIAPHGTGGKLNVIQLVYNEANLLEREDVWLEQTAEPPGLLDPGAANQHLKHPVMNIDYNAKGQRVLIEYGNGVVTNYIYDPFTFRLEHLKTLRGTDSLQDILYTYDPGGNITAIRDDAQTIIYYDGEKVNPVSEYRYDAIYRLIEASGREHIGLASKQYTTWNDEGRTNLTHPNDGQKMRNYSEVYRYDEVGNILFFDHNAKKGNWDRAYEYEESSLTELNRKNNRLSRTIVHPNGQQPIKEPYTYDPHGNMMSMPHLKNMEWDFKDQLQHVDKGNEQVYYVYGAGGQRVRKVAEKNNGTLIEERIYLGGFEIFHRHELSELMLERETLHIMDDKQRIAMVETRTLDTAGTDPTLPQLIRYQLGNHLGSAVLELDENAHRISCEEYYPYGSTSYQAVRKDIEVPLKRYRYTGMERDEETGLNYHGARYYAPWLGRWTSCDPQGIIDGLNIYVYAQNNPKKNIDVTGRATTYNPLTSPSAKSASKQAQRLDKSALSKTGLTGTEKVVKSGKGGSRLDTWAATMTK
jgi:RHS repeat-associated protein